MTQQSRLRLVNRGEVEARVEVEGTDDGGTRSEGRVELTVPARGACTLTSDELESGEAEGDCACEVSGALGVGTGKWQLSVTTEQSIQVMSVLKTPEHLTNLSTVEYAGFAPVDADAFKERFVGRRVRATDDSGYIDFVSARRYPRVIHGADVRRGATPTKTRDRTPRPSSSATTMVTCVRSLSPSIRSLPPPLSASARTRSRRSSSCSRCGAGRSKKSARLQTARVSSTSSSPPGNWRRARASAPRWCSRLRGSSARAPGAPGKRGVTPT